LWSLRASQAVPCFGLSLPDSPVRERERTAVSRCRWLVLAPCATARYFDSVTRYFVLGAAISVLIQWKPVPCSRVLFTAAWARYLLPALLLLLDSLPPVLSFGSCVRPIWFFFYRSGGVSTCCSTRLSLDPVATAGCAHLPWFSFWCRRPCPVLVSCSSTADLLYS
jgi:hypothetical protein